MATTIQGSGNSSFGGTIDSTGIDDNATSTAITIDSSERVGIGTSSPASKLDIASGGKLYLRRSDNATGATIHNGGGGVGLVFDELNNEPVAFKQNGTERMRIDSNGSLLVGKTAQGISAVGFELNHNDYFGATRNGAPSAYFNRTTNDGSIIEFRKNNTAVGAIGVRDSLDPFFVSPEGSGTGLRMNGGFNSVQPCSTNGADRDNVVDLGHSTARFDDIYATNGTIQTSDRNEKQDIEELTEAEQRVAVACKGLMRKFRWKDAVSEKGDDARIHFGIIAQDLQDAFTAEGLDAHRYAMFISTTWWETQTEVPAVEAVAEELDEDGNVIVEAVEAKDAYTRVDTYETAEEAPEGATERTRLGVRYPELLAFIISAI